MIHILCGISNSGKSVKARQLLTKYGGPNSAVIIGRDKIRELVLGLGEAEIYKHYESPSFMQVEKEITKYEDSLIRFALNSGKTVISDNTHLRKKYLTRYEKFGVPICYELVEVDYDLALERDTKRLRKVGKTVIDRQWDSLRRLKQEFDFKPWYPDNFTIPEYSSAKPNAILFDIDGTLALNLGGRNPYHWDRVGEDDENFPVAELFRTLKDYYKNSNTKLIVCSGRDGSCQDITLEWLEYYDLMPAEFYCRARNDSRADYIVKTEFIKEISQTYNILFAVDDRQQVVDCYRRMKICVMQVAEGSF